MDLGLSQEQLAQQIGVPYGTLRSWELHKSKPSARFLPKIYAFLGYPPHDPADSLPQKLKVWREALGLSQNRLAKALGIGSAAVSRWERGIYQPEPENLKLLLDFFRGKLGGELKI